MTRFKAFRLALGFCFLALPSAAQVPVLRVAFYVFQDDQGAGNFHADSIKEVAFLHEVVNWINFRTANLDTLFPAVSSAYVKDAGFRIRMEGLYFERDSRAWDASEDPPGPYIRSRYIDLNPGLSYRQKHQTLPIFISGNHPVVGGHSRNIGDKGFIAMRGFYHQYQNSGTPEAVEECARNLLHEIGHCVGLHHNFSGSPEGDQCDACDDNGCPPVGTSNNIMDYWPSYGHALSVCQTEIVKAHLTGRTGNIGDVVINDSCGKPLGPDLLVKRNDTLRITEVRYVNGNLEIQEGGRVEVTGYLSMAAGTRILIQPGGSLLIQGGTIGNLCGDLWDGVLVERAVAREHTGLRITGGGMIENALTGITLHNGGVLESDRAILRNNVTGLRMPDSLGVSLYISGYQFSTTRLLNHHEEGYFPDASIRFTLADTVRVFQCELYNEPGTYLFEPARCGDGLVGKAREMEIAGCTFTQLNEGVCAAVIGAARIQNNRFINNRSGLSLVPGLSAVIRDNQFELQRLNDVPVYGLVLSGAGYSQVVGNRFSSEYGGGRMAAIALQSPGYTPAWLAGSEFHNLPVACVVFDPADPDKPWQDWANTYPTDISGLEAGPVFGKSFYTLTPVRLMIFHDSGRATVFGEPDAWEANRENLPNVWPYGGFQWFAADPKLAVYSQDDGFKDPVEPLHGISWFANPDFLLPDSIESAAVNELAAAIRELDAIDREVSQWLTGNLQGDVGLLSAHPWAARSSKIMGQAESKGLLERAWTRTALGASALMPTRADSVLATVMDSLARLRATAPSIEALPDSLISLPTLPFWPIGRYMRFESAKESQKPDPAFRVRPLPASREIYMVPEGSYVPDATWRYQLVSARGQILRSAALENWAGLKIDLTGLSPGMYLIRIFAGKEELGAQRFIIQNDDPD